MESSTETSVRVLIGTMPRIKKERFIRDLLAELPEERNSHDQIERIVRRAEAAKLLGRSLRAIDLLREQGHLKPITMPGRNRGAGFRLSDVMALINGKVG